MRNHWIWPGLLGALLFVSLAAVQASVAADRPWVEARSPHFTVITDAGQQRGREVLSHFEEMRSVFGAFMDAPNLSLPAPLKIVAFRNTKEMRRFVPLWQGKPIDMMGYFHQSGDCGVILLDLSVKHYEQTAFHEYAHQLLNANTAVETQPWFEEGFAEYFSTMRTRGDGAEVGGVHEKNWKTVRHKRLMSTAALLQVRQDSAIYNQNGESRNVFYGQSWLMVHYLFESHALPSAFQYFELLSQGAVDVEDAFRQAFGMSTMQFDQRLRQYAREKNLDTTEVAIDSPQNKASYAVRPLSATDAEAELADVHLHSPDYGDQAVREFDSILRRAPTQPVALRGLGYAYLQDRDFTRAAQFLNRAEQSDPNDPRVHYYKALLIKEEAGAEGHPAPEGIAAMEHETRRVLDADPDYAAAYQLLALAYQWEGNTARSIEAMKRAAKLNPRSRSYRAELIRMGFDGESTAGILKQLDARAPSATQARFGQAKTGGASAPAK